MLNHNFKKKFGQNFISDKNLLKAICNDADINEDDEVLEIGAGGGSLTEALSESAKRVVSYEIDNDLKDHLLSLNLENVEFLFDDVMNYSLDEIEKDFKNGYKMVANLPYYITTPILFKFLKSTKLTSLTIMVQKEVAERMIATAGGKNYGVLSVMTAYYGNAEIKRVVSRKLFYPQPNVDSAIVNITLNHGKTTVKNGDKFYKFVGGMFAMRRKPLRNNLAKFGVNTEKLALLGEDTLAKRAEEFDLYEIMEIYLKLFN